MIIITSTLKRARATIHGGVTASSPGKPNVIIILVGIRGCTCGGCLNLYLNLRSHPFSQNLSVRQLMMTMITWLFLVAPWHPAAIVVVVVVVGGTRSQGTIVICIFVAIITAIDINIKPSTSSHWDSRAAYRMRKIVILEIFFWRKTN